MNFQTFILEDDAAFLQILSIRLQSWKKDITLHVTKSIAEGRALLDATPEAFSLAILDHHLPDGLGVELLNHPKLRNAAILAVSADIEPELPGNTLKAGAQHFLGKRQVTEPLFLPLLEALVERKQLEQELINTQIHRARMHSMKVMLATLRHEINNPLGAVLGGTYLLRAVGNLDPKQIEALGLIEQSGQRIKHVLQQLCEAAELSEVTKAHEQVFHVPGDNPWSEGPREQAKK